MARGFDPNTTLGVCWSKRENDWAIYFPKKCDGHLLVHDLVGTESFKDLICELKKRGYDTQTLRFSVKKKATPDA